MILEVPWDGLWTLSFGLSQFHGHGSWLVCEVALSVQDKQSCCQWMANLGYYSFVNQFLASLFEMAYSNFLHCTKKNELKISLIV
jgi:hypothetical protein